MPEQSLPTRAVFLSYASQDAEAAARICEALRAAGVEVWFDRSELRGGDAWDSQIKKQIHDCALFLPIISAHTNARTEGYFRREWKLATRRLLDIADDAAFLVPVVIDETHDADARVPEEFPHVQWTRLPGGETPPAFARRVRQLLGLDSAPVPTAKAAATGAMEPSTRIRGSVGLLSAPLVRRFGLPLIVLLLVLGAGTIWYYQVSGDAPAVKPALGVALPNVAVAPDDKSIAVLPFVDMSPAKDQEYMSDGIAEELLSQLAQAPDLKVIARTSSFSFKNQKVAIAEIARQLNVAYLLEGSVRKSGETLRITAQLIRAADSFRLWSARYDRPLDDIFAVQDEIASAIAKALQIELTESDVRRRDGGTQNLAAYELYLRAKRDLYFIDDIEASLNATEDAVNKALELDPNYGRAWILLSNVIYTKGQYRLLPLKEAAERSRQLLAHAVQLSPDLAEAHANLQSYYIYEDFDWAAAEIAGQRARELDPNDWSVLVINGEIAQIQGRHDEAIRFFRMALDRSPLDDLQHRRLADAYYCAERFVEAESIFRGLVERIPEGSSMRGRLAKVLLAEGKPEDALAMLQQETKEEDQLEYLPMMLHAVGRDAESDAALKAQIALYGNDLPYLVVQSYAIRGDYARAIQWLDRAYRQKDWRILFLFNDPLLKGLTADPRFNAFVRDTLNFPV
jgi:TolB-like protein/Flp pilus assembly protein TadD